jgi:hypothetical protein
VTLSTTIVRRRLADLTPLEVNARYMRKEVFDTLVANIRRDGCLTSTPLIYGGGEYPEGRELILSGNHRVAAGIEAGVTEDDFKLIDQPIPKARQIALQLSHNAIDGDDDLSVLKQLYESIDTMDDRVASGLDDKTLELLEKIDAESLSEANLDFHTVQIVFLPAEADSARKSFEELGKTADERWLAAYKDYTPLLDALASVHGAYNVGNVAVALGILIELGERNLTDMQEGFLDDNLEARHRGQVGLEVVLGQRTVPAATAAALTRALRTAVADGKVEPDKPHQLFDLLIANWMEVRQ